jgi:acyl dehydratase
MVDTLVSPAARAMIGEVTAGPNHAVITAREAQRYARAVDDLNPVYFDEAAAHDAGYRTLVAPPTFLDHVTVEGGAVGELRADGLFRGAEQRGPEMGRVMFGGQEWEWYEPAYVGDSITAVQRLTGIDEKTGSKGPFVLITWETEYTNQHGTVLARSRQQGISR